MSKKARKALEAAVVTSTNVEGVEMLDINEVAMRYNLSAVYVRNAIRHGKLATTLTAVSETSKTQKHMIAVSDVEAWRAASSARSHREDGRSKYNLYATAEERAAIEALLANNQIEALITKAYTKAEATEAAE